MDLHLTCDPSETLRLHCNGRLIAEITAGQAVCRDTLLIEVQQARRQQALPRQLRALVAELARCGDLPDEGKTPATKRTAYHQGLVDGLLQRTVPHPLPGVPPIRPAYSPSYERGYDAGDALIRCLTSEETPQ